MKIEETFNDVIKTIKETDIYLNYQHILKQVEKNKDINNLVNRIKKIQQKIVKDNYNKIDTSQTEQELDKIKNQLYQIPLYQDYINVSEELNSMIKIVRDKIQICIDDLVV